MSFLRIAYSWTIVSILTFSIESFGQNISDVTATLNSASGSIHITYNFNGPADRYRVELHCSLDSGKNFSESLIGVSGDIGYNIKPGKGKKIDWAYFIDMPDFSGKNAVFKVIAYEDIEFKENLILALGGPERSYQSILIPGLGNKHVRHKNQYWITGLVYGLLAGGTYLHYKANNYYSAYQNSTNSTEATSNFNNATNFGKTSSILLTSGFAIWTIDVMQVFGKGVMNRKKQKEILRKRNK